MKLLLDQNLSAAAAEILRATGMDVFMRARSDSRPLTIATS